MSEDPAHEWLLKINDTTGQTVLEMPSDKALRRITAPQCKTIALALFYAIVDMTKKVELQTAMSQTLLYEPILELMKNLDVPPKTKFEVIAQARKDVETH